MLKTSKLPSYREYGRAYAYSDYPKAESCLLECKNQLSSEDLLDLFYLDYKLAEVIAFQGRLEEANKLILGLDNAPEELMIANSQWRFYLKTDQLEKAYEKISTYLEDKEYLNELPEYIYGESVAYSSLALLYAKKSDFQSAVSNLIKATHYDSAYYILQTVNIILSNDEHRFDKEINSFLDGMYSDYDKKTVTDPNFSAKQDYLNWIIETKKKLV